MLKISTGNDVGCRASHGLARIRATHLPTEDPQDPQDPHKPPPPVPGDEPPPIPEGDPPSEAPPERAD
jgi:hypothetical protein